MKNLIRILPTLFLLTPGLTVNTNNTQININANDNQFHAMTGTNELIITLTSDKEGNIYAGTYLHVYKCLAGENDFKVISNLNYANDLTSDSYGNIYAATRSGVFECLAVSSEFNLVANFTNYATKLTIDTNNTLYVATNDGGRIKLMVRFNKNINER
ncbi:hypothetical protein [Spiroplasma endosymbiont of Virgichneumon dumeticola]|uniref:hypothetical protein n=1 Tax=Spiroplasma endosymbiont of Virgichneumon dumeticola TaxID=3139323 RepID=UPI0035C8F829